MIPTPYSVSRYAPLDVPRSEWGWFLVFRDARNNFLGVYFVPGGAR